MLGDRPVMAFVPTSDLARARDFYGETLGLEVVEVSPYAVVLRAGDGVLVRVTRVDDLRPQPFTVLGWVVEDLDGAVADLAARGVTPLSFDGMGHDERGVWTTPGGDQVLWFRDPDGNVLSLTRFA
jgi:catechol 2,3-dioxygenase-like lactoylglutathione lyase family enzyme